MEILSDPLTECNRKELREVLHTRINSWWWNRKKHELENLNTYKILNEKLTLLQKSWKFLSTIAFTTLPLTSASQILIWVLNTSNNVKITTNLNSLLVYPGTATFKSLLILAKNCASTFPAFFYNIIDQGTWLNTYISGWLWPFLVLSLRCSSVRLGGAPKQHNNRYNTNELHGINFDQKDLLFKYLDFSKV